MLSSSFQTRHNKHKIQKASNKSSDHLTMMNPSTKYKDMTCGICCHDDCDLKIIGCGCSLHARCTPLDLALGENNLNANNNGRCDTRCPVCSTVSKSGLYLFPLIFNDLEESIKLRKEKALNTKNKKRSREESEETSRVEISFSVYSHGSASRTSIQRSNAIPDLSRTGRWNEAELAFTDYLVASFDKGNLALPNGTKLNQFLGDLLLCKASRLTKKMRNAKLSTRSYERRAFLSPQDPHNNPRVLASLEEAFVASLDSDIARREVSFNLAKQWRSYLSNMCLQANTQTLNIRDWVTSIEELERRTSSTEDALKKILRRRNMGITSSSTTETNISSNKRARRVSTMEEVHNYNAAAVLNPAFSNVMDGLSEVVGLDIFENDDHVEVIPSTPSVFADAEEDDEDFGDDFFSALLDSSEDKPSTCTTDFRDAVLVEESSIDSSSGRDISSEDGGSVSAFTTTVPTKRRSPKNFLDAIGMYLEEHNLPFQHADCWAPVASQNPLSKASGSGADTGFRLFHGGNVTRNDASSQVKQAMKDFGDYSSSFSFFPGYGLPGRAFADGEPQWEYDMRALDSKSLTRASGAIAHGIKTAAAVPISCVGVGRMVIVVYSNQHISRDLKLLTDMGQKLQQYAPQPKWRMVIDIQTPTDDETSTKKEPTRASASHHASTMEADTSTHFNDKILQTLGDIDPLADLTGPNEFLSNQKFDTSNMGSNHRLGLPDDAATKQQQDKTINEMITMLGSQMLNSNGSSMEHNQPTNDLMGMRRFLLRSPSNCSRADCEVLETLKYSYQSYASSNKRHGSELCELLVKDWICLKSSLQSNPIPSMDGAVRPRPSNTATKSTKPATAAMAMAFPPLAASAPWGAVAATGASVVFSKPPPMAHSSHLMARTRSLPKMMPLDPTGLPMARPLQQRRASYASMPLSFFPPSRRSSMQ